MPKRTSTITLDYAVGYGRPPKSGQFKPGQSGNPKGRTKGSRTVGSIIQDIIQQRVTVTEGGKTRRLTALEVMFHRLKNDALRGDQKAMKFLLSLLDRYASSPETKVQLQELLAEDKAILEQYLRPSAPADTDSTTPPTKKELDDNV